MKKPTASSPANTRQRLLLAAARVYARAGLTGATTRAIADEAGVNEVTLFRHFKSKERLLAAVVGENFGEVPAQKKPTPALSGNLREDLLALASHYEQLLTENLPLVRTMIGEIHHHGREHERQVFKSIFRPVKEALVARIENARVAKQLRTDTDADLTGDYLGGMIFTDVLRRSSGQIKLSYSSATYLTGAIDLLLRGLAPESKHA